MRASLRLRLAVVLLALFAVATAFAAPAQHVIIVSLDGGRPDVILTSNTPNIHELAASGAYTWWAHTIIPSITLPSHCSMLTGCEMAKHGITWNDKFREDAGYVRVATCFEIAKAGGFTTAMFVAKDKLRHIAKPGTVDELKVINGNAVAVAGQAGEYFKATKPGLMFVHFGDSDAAGHSKGWGSPAHHAAIETCDQGVGLLRAAIKDSGVADSTVLIVTADHGGHLLTHGSTDVRDMTIPWIAGGAGVAVGELQAPPFTCDTAATAVTLLGLKPDANWDGKAVTEAFTALRNQPAPVAVPAP